MPSRNAPRAEECLDILMFFCFNNNRILTPNGSANASDMPLIWIRVGSALASAPKDTINLHDKRLQANMKSLFVSVSSMQSNTKSGFPLKVHQTLGLYTCD